MWSAKKLILGGLAVSGVAAAGYFAYRYYKNRNVCPEEVKQEETEGDNDDAAVQYLDTELQMDKKVESTAEENTKVDDEPVESVAVETETKVNEVVAAKEDAKPETEPVEFAAEENAKVDEEVAAEENAKVDAEPVERTEAQPVQTFPPTPRPRCLHHVRTLKELDMTFEALSAYLFTQNRTAEELKEVEKELGWVWYVALGYRNRLPNNVPLLVNEEDNDTALPLENEDGMQSVD